MVANAPAIYVHRRVLYGCVSWKAACFISEPALELVALPRSGEPHISRAASSVGVMYRVSGPNTGSNPGGGRILNKKIKKKHFWQNRFKRDWHEIDASTCHRTKKGKFHNSLIDNTILECYATHLSLWRAAIFCGTLWVPLPAQFPPYLVYFACLVGCLTARGTRAGNPTNKL